MREAPLLTGSTFMISGRKADRFAHIFMSSLRVYILLVLSISHVHAESTTDIKPDQLMEKLAAVRVSGGRFTERKYLSILSEPLILRGTVLYEAPDYVKKEYDDPYRERFEVRGDHLTIEFADGRRRDLSIDEHPVLRAFVESYRSTLSGDLETLGSFFEIELTGPLDDWELRLRPLRKDLGDFLSAVVMRGRGDAIYSVETLEANGDRSVMTLDTPGE